MLVELYLIAFSSTTFKCNLVANFYVFLSKVSVVFTRLAGENYNAILSIEGEIGTKLFFGKYLKPD